MLGRACSLVESHGLFVSAVVSIKSHPANSRQVALPHLHANSTGLPGFVRILRLSPRLPPSLPTTSVDQKAKEYLRPLQLKFAVSHKQSTYLTVSSHGRQG